MARFALGFVVGFVTALAPLLSVGRYLRAADAPQRADVIVAISGDLSARATAAVALYHARYAPLILFSGGTRDQDFVDLPAVASAELMRRQAIASGVPDDAILVETRSRTTEENAKFVRDLMRERHLRSALLVTSPHHQRRASIEFARAFAGTDLMFRNVPADDPSWDPTFWWLDPVARDLTLRELAKLSVTLVSPSR